MTEQRPLLLVLVTVLTRSRVFSKSTQITTPEIKQVLTENTELALQNGAFGLPYFVGMQSNIVLLLLCIPCATIAALLTSDQFVEHSFECSWCYRNLLGIRPFRYVIGQYCICCSVSAIPNCDG